MSYFRKSFKPSDEKLKDKENLIQDIEYRMKIDPSFRDGNGRTQLHVLLRNGSDVPENVEQLIAAGCEVNVEDLFGNYCVHVCAEYGLPKCCKKLIYKNALLDVFNKDGLTPLMLACLRKRPEVVTLLLQHGANPNLQTTCKRTAIHYAVQGRSNECLQILIESRAKINVKDLHGDSALILAAKLSVEGAVRILIGQRGINMNGCDVHRKTALHWAAENGSLIICRVLVKAGADLDILDQNMETPFIKALKKSKTEVMKYLLDQGCDRYSVDGLNGTPLALAALYGLDDSLSVLLDSGEDPDAYSFIGMTALMIAIFEAQITTVDLLLEKGANPNARSRSGKTPLAISLLAWNSQNELKRHEIIKMLIRAGAEVNDTMSQVNTAMMPLWSGTCPQKAGSHCMMSFAIHTGYLSNVQLLLAGGSCPTPPQVRMWCSAVSKVRNGAEFSDFFTLINSVCTQPRSLKYIARAVIRKSLDRSPGKKIPSLPLANPLLHYVDMRDLDDIPIEENSHCRNLSELVMTMMPMTPCCSTTFKGTLLSKFIAPTVDICNCECCVKFRNSQNCMQMQQA